MRSRTKTVPVVLLAAILALFFVPGIPLHASSYSGPSSVPPMNVGILRDPSGTYQQIYLGNGTYSMNLTAYEKLLNDPYSGISASSVQISGTTVLLTVPISNTVSGTTTPTHPPASAPNVGFESVTSYFIGYGGLYVNGRYVLL